MKWELAMIAATVLVVAGVSRRLTGTPVTPAMVFVLVGVLVGPLVIDEVTAAPTGEGVRTLAETTLAVVLFADASRIKPRVLTKSCEPVRPRASSHTDDERAIRSGDGYSHVPAR
jgi:sodium/hydrogen antiporter